MLISTRGRYALRVMIDLAEHNDGSFVTLREIAERQGISEKYLESIIVSLSRAGCVSAIRGKGGGYRLARRAEDYTAAEILSLTEKSLAPVSCLNGEMDCARSDVCQTLPLWKGLDRVVDGYLSRVTLADLLAGTVPEC